jgi:hypothetical protein
MNNCSISDFLPDGEEDFAAELLKILRGVSTNLKYLGTGDSGSGMGAVEFLAVKVEEGFTRLAGAQRESAGILADALTESAQIIADAPRSKVVQPRNVAAEPHPDEVATERELRRGNAV